MLSHFDRGHKTTPTFGIYASCRSGLLTAITHRIFEELGMRQKLKYQDV